MTEVKRRGRPKKDPNAPKQRYNYSAAVKARKQTQRRLTEAKKRAAKITKQAESKRRYARKLEEKITKVDKALNQKETTVIDKEDLKFDIRFHLDPSSKVMKTQDNKTILIEIGDEGWKFNCNNYEVNIENGLFFNSKSTYVENQNIFISGIINSKNSDIKWELIKI